MTEALLAIFTGFLVGVLFRFLKMPLPAPQVLPGILGIFGIYLGGRSVPFIQKYAVMLMGRLH